MEYWIYIPSALAMLFMVGAVRHKEKISIAWLALAVIFWPTVWPIVQSLDLGPKILISLGVGVCLSLYYSWR